MAFNLDNRVLISYKRLPAPDGVSDGLGWSLKRMIKSVKEVVKHPLRNPLKTIAVVATGGVYGAALGLKPETLGRYQRRIGGAVVGAVTGFVTGGPAGAAVGAGMGMLKARKGVKGIKGYGKIGLISAATGFVAGGVAGAAGYGSYGGFGAKAYAFGAGKVAALTTGKVASATSLIPTAMGVMKRSSAPADTSSVESPTGEGLYSENWQPPSTPSPAAQNYMDLIRQTAGAASKFMPSGGSGTSAELMSPTGSAEDTGLMPQNTGERIPGQVDYPITAGIFAPENIKWILLAGGVAILLYGTSQSRKRRA